MKLSLLVVSLLACLAGCSMQAGEDTKDSATNTQAAYAGQGNYSPGSASPGQLCSAASHFIVNTSEGLVVIDLPANCNPTIGPDRGDPAPDYASDPWDSILRGNFNINPAPETHR